MPLSSLCRDTGCVAEMAFDLGGEFDGISGHSVDEGRVPTPQETKAGDIKSGGGSDPAGVDDLTRRVEHRHVQPAIVPFETSSPDDRPDAIACKIERSGRCVESKSSRPGLDGNAGGIGRRIDTLKHALETRLCGGNRLRQIVVDVQYTVPDANRASDQSDANLAQCPNVDAGL